jgi:hypothetical protein
VCVCVWTAVVARLVSFLSQFVVLYRFLRCCGTASLRVFRSRGILSPTNERRENGNLGNGGGSF